jgi:hypothetical protein
MDHGTIFQRRIHPLAAYACNGEDAHEYRNHHSVCGNGIYVCDDVLCNAFCATYHDTNVLYDNSVGGSDHELCVYDDMICDAFCASFDDDHNHCVSYDTHRPYHWIYVAYHLYHVPLIHLRSEPEKQLT